MNAITNTLIARIKKLPNTVVQDSRTDEGLGAIVIYETTHKGVKSKSIWMGRPSTNKNLRSHIAARTQEVAA